MKTRHLLAVVLAALTLVLVPSAISGTHHVRRNATPPSSETGVGAHHQTAAPEPPCAVASEGQSEPLHTECRLWIAHRSVLAGPQNHSPPAA